MSGPGDLSAVQARARRKVEELQEYEARHPRQGPDAAGRPYDPWHDIIVDPWDDGTLDPRQEMDAARTNTIAPRIWEGFAWASSRFVLSDEWGNAVIVGYNENAGRWFVDSNTPVRLPVEWVAEFVANWDEDGRITGFEDPRALHEEIVRSVGKLLTTIPSLDEITEYLALRQAADPRVVGAG